MKHAFLAAALIIAKSVAFADPVNVLLDGSDTPYERDHSRPGREPARRALAPGRARPDVDLLGP